MAFKDGGTVKKITPPPPAIDRPALGPVSVDNQNAPTYHGHVAGPERPTAPMPGPGGPNSILTPIPAVSQQEAE